MVRVAIFGGKFQERRYFTFAMASWKLCASTTFEILQLLTCTLCKRKSYISKGIQPIFENFGSARRCLVWTFRWKVSGAQVFHFCNGKVKTLRMDNIWNFSTFNLYTVPAKILYLQSCSTDFRNLFLSSKMLRVGFFCGKIHVSRYFTFAIARWKLCAATTFEILPLSTCTLCQKKSYISKGIQPIFEIFASARICWGWTFAWKVSGAQVFYFAMASWERCTSTTFEILPHLTCTRCQQKCKNSKGIQPNFENFGSTRRCWGWTFPWKVSGAHVFSFCNGKVKTLRIDNIWNFATFNLYTVPAKILYLQRYWTDVLNLCLSSKIFRVGIWEESFSYTGILVMQWQGENFAHWQHLKFRHFQRVMCASKNPISPKVFNQFSKSLLHLEDVKGGNLGGKFKLHSYFSFAMARGKLAHRQHLKFCHFQHVHCARINSISPKVFIRFSKTSAQLEVVEGEHLGGKFQVRGYFTFAMACWELSASTRFEIFPLLTNTLRQQKSKNPKELNRFSKNSPQLEYFEGGH